MNQASTRSHCIFTIHATSRETGSATIRKAKLHLVDLAGSERIGKTNANGVLLTEAKYINLSLHYLEQVKKRAFSIRGVLLKTKPKTSLGNRCVSRKKSFARTISQFDDDLSAARQSWRQLHDHYDCHVLG